MGKITCKKPLEVWAWLDTALNKEWQKYATTPVTLDWAPGHELAQAWGYVVAGYFLIEQGLKAVLCACEIEPPKIHSLSVLFAKLPTEDQDILREYYNDFRCAFPSMNSFPLATLDKFLMNLDGTKNDQGRYIGSFDWRYFLTEEGHGATMPLVSINVMHEIVYGCVQLARPTDKRNGRAGKATYSWRLHWKRRDLQQDWLAVRMNLPEWRQESNRLEILWGPDYDGRYDYLVFQDGQIQSFFSPLPNTGGVKLKVIDKRSELESFDPEEEFRSIGITVNQPARRRDAESFHVMY